MTSSSISGSSRPQPLQPSSDARPAGRPTTANVDPNDARAMRNALATAKGAVDRQAGEKQTGGKLSSGKQMTGKQTGQADKKQLATTGGDRARDNAAATTDRADGESATAHLKSHEEGADSLAGWAGQGAGAAQAIPVLDAAAPHVDAGAFAQMLADLWTRENGRGSKEVRVRFGSRSWPATGAVLVRNAAGTLDVTLQVGDAGEAYGSALPDLEDAMGSAGIALGSLTIERG